MINLGSANLLHANGGVPPPPPPQHGEGGNVPGGGAPVGEGLLILSVLAGAWGTRKVYVERKKSQNM
jgi:hypothetical protein